jgi:hypothetical protein
MQNQTEDINFYSAIREIESSSNPFSITWCSYSYNKDVGGKLVTKNNLLFTGKRVTDDYELIFFKDDKENVVACHLFSIMYYNGKKLTI